jgi:hypothetical protein
MLHPLEIPLQASKLVPYGRLKISGLRSEECGRLTSFAGGGEADREVLGF